MPRDYIESDRQADDGFIKLTLEQRLKACLLIVQGYEREHIAERFGLSKKALAKVLRAHGVKLAA